MAGLNLTDEQLEILEYCKNNEGTVMINAVAGSGKTTMLKAISANVPNKSSLYLAYNKAIAEESKAKFPSTVKCMTTHSLAYRAIVIPNNYKVGMITYRDLPKTIKYDTKLEVLNHLKEFCLSKYIDLDQYITDKDLQPKHSRPIKQLYNDMVTGTKVMSHEMYLKLYQMKLANGTLPEPYDIIMLDEAGDLNEVTVEIFKLLPAKLKIAVGDEHQNIYTFNHTINCFKVLEGKQFYMTQSFRVAPDIAEQIETFCKANLSKKMVFKGTTQNRQIESKAYISRTNSALISKIVECQDNGVSYGLKRPAKDIFKLPIILSYIEYKHYIANPEYKHLQADVDAYYDKAIEDYITMNYGKNAYIRPAELKTITNTIVKERYYKMLRYLQLTHKDDINLNQAVNIVVKYKRAGIKTIYDVVLEQENKNKKKEVDITLCTAHSSKGLEFDHVELAPDMNTSLTKVFDGSLKKFSDEMAEIEALNLYYVACTRASIRLDNAEYLTGRKPSRPSDDWLDYDPYANQDIP